MEKPVVRISVRNLVEFILRSGDLDSRRGTSDKEAMLKGSRLHRKIQRQMGSEYQAEVSLKWETEYEDMTILVEGRADGILEREGTAVIDEIKGIYKNPEHLKEPIPVHLAQAKCYARMYGEMEDLEEIEVQMTYANLDTEEIRRFHETFQMDELKGWYENLINEYHKWVSFQQCWRKDRNRSMQELSFPFSYRKGQKKMVSSVYHTISVGKQIFIQAPTGVGKTMSTIFPAVRAVGEGKAETIFYLTAKTITRTVAEEAFSILQQKGLLYKVITITAKEKLCFMEKVQCNPEACSYAKGHLDRVNDAVYQLLTENSIYDWDVILAHAEKWKVCPFEMCLDLAAWVDAVICDYNYVFDPNVYLKRFFGENVSGKYVFLIDEAHNLVERGREMYSAGICKEDVLSVRSGIKDRCKGLARALGRVNRQLLELKKNYDIYCEENHRSYMVLDDPGVLSLSLLKVQGEIDKLLEEPPYPEFGDEIADFYFSVRDFLNIAELLDENYVVYAETGEDGKFQVRLYCVNPAVNLHERMEKGVSTIFFSATLLPMGYYRSLLSTEKDDYGIYVESPFDREKRCILLGGDASSKYTRRNYEEYRRIAEYISRMVWQKKGNYMVFFPSYRFMEEVYQVYQEEFAVDWIRCICQSNAMSEREREEFLEEFKKKETSLVAFCIMGGIFSEGIDLKGEDLIGAVIVGTGLPQISNEREILREYYFSRGKNGFDFSYRYPGMNKVLQAAGRVIRTQEDEGVILLLDERFLSGDYQMLFPPEWSDRRSCSLGSVERFIKEFWEK